MSTQQTHSGRRRLAYANHGGRHRSEFGTPLTLTVQQDLEQIGDTCLELTCGKIAFPANLFDAADNQPRDEKYRQSSLRPSSCGLAREDK
jgi:hypothetical protein